MEPPETKVSDTQTTAGAFQYTLRTMFIVMTVLAVALSGIYAGPPWASMLTGLALGLLAPMVLTIGTIYGRGYARTFCIGGLFPAGLIFIALIPQCIDFVPRVIGWERYYRTYPSSDEILPWRVALSIFVGGVMVVVSGLVALGVRWMVEAPQRRREREVFLCPQAPHTSGPAAPAPPES